MWICLGLNSTNSKDSKKQSLLFWHCLDADIRERVNAILLFEVLSMGQSALGHILFLFHELSRQFMA